MCELCRTIEPGKSAWAKLQQAEVDVEAKGLTRDEALVMSFPRAVSARFPLAHTGRPEHEQLEQVDDLILTPTEQICYLYQKAYYAFMEIHHGYIVEAIAEGLKLGGQPYTHILPRELEGS